MRVIFIAFASFMIAAIPAGATAGQEKDVKVEGGLAEVNLDGFAAWTKNPELDLEKGKWWVRTFCWTIGADCPDDLKLSRAEWDEDGVILLRAEDDDTKDMGCDCAAMTQGTGFDGSVRGDPLTRLRTGDVEAAYVRFHRSNAGAASCTGVTGAGNIINLWLRHPDGAIWVTDFYFETEGLNAGFDERPGPHNPLISKEKGVDWYAYQVLIKNFPEYWTKTTHPDGSEHWTIDLKGLLDRGAAFSERKLDDYLWYYVDVVSEDVCYKGMVGESAAWQTVHYFEILVKTHERRGGPSGGDAAK
ncbi:MAG: hypothetical protein AB1742_00210 [bacterium]